MRSMTSSRNTVARVRPILILVVLLLSRDALADVPACEGTCVPAADMQAFAKLLHDKKCEQTTTPEFKLDQVTLTEDKDGRVFVSGGGSVPYKLHMKWCEYEADTTGSVNVVVAKTPVPTWGLRFRLKAAPSYLPLAAVAARDGYAGLDFGLLAEPFFISWANINVYAGVRSLGAGVGFDLTRNLGLYLGYAITIGSWVSGPHVALSFALW